MIYFFNQKQTVFAVSSQEEISKENLEKLIWLFGNAKELKSETLKGNFVGPRKEMISPWSTNAVEITQNMGITGISRIPGLNWPILHATLSPGRFGRHTKF